MKKLIKFLTSRIFIFGFSIAAQAAALVLGIAFLSKYDYYIYIGFSLLSAVTLIYIVSKRENPIYKLAWTLPIALFPLLGWAIYLLAGRESLPKQKRKRARRIYEQTYGLAPQDPALLQQISRERPDIGRQVSYLANMARLPVYDQTETEYLSPGEVFFERLCQELEKAQHFIFMEYFILEEGRMWDTILEILARKAAAGVEVKLMYDDFGCLFTLPGGYAKKLRGMGIEVHVFNAFRPSLDAFMNYRDHRKITVIDGSVGFTGGNNLADEYINAYAKHGHWKDSSLLLKGKAVWNLSVLFLQMWQFYQNENIDYDRYRPTKPAKSDGYVLPFGDSPLDSELVGEMAYMNMIQNAKRYVSITTPYLILDNEMITALRIAAQSGVKIQIVTPAIADKWYVHMVTRYNYSALVEAGVEIYEYTGGFIHAKTIVCDDEIAIVGTQNFDFRSFYLHFECGALLYHTQSVAQVREDHQKVIARSEQISLENCRSRHWTIRVLQACLNLFSPLL